MRPNGKRAAIRFLMAFADMRPAQQFITLPKSDYDLPVLLLMGLQQETAPSFHLTAGYFQMQLSSVRLRLPPNWLYPFQYTPHLFSRNCIFYQRQRFLAIAPMVLTVYYNQTAIIRLIKLLYRGPMPPAPPPARR